MPILGLVPPDPPDTGKPAPEPAKKRPLVTPDGWLAWAVIAAAIIMSFWLTRCEAERLERKIDNHAHEVKTFGEINADPPMTICEPEAP